MNVLDNGTYYWINIVPVFGSDEATQRAFAQCLVDGELFDLPDTIKLTTWGVLQRYANWPMIHAMLLARVVKATEKPKRTATRKK